MLGVQIKSNYRQCGPSASLRKDIGDTDGYLMFFFFPSLLSLSFSLCALKQPAASEVMGEDLSETPLEMSGFFLFVFFHTYEDHQAVEDFSSHVSGRPNTLNEGFKV